MDKAENSTIGATRIQAQIRKLKSIVISLARSLLRR
jgi:hypothetical protein